MRYSLDQVLIVMPAKDEEDAIAGVISEVRSLLPEVAVLVVNDGSTDQTSTLARTAGAQVLDLPYNPVSYTHLDVYKRQRSLPSSLCCLSR